jgi:hypothetical protein
MLQLPDFIRKEILDSYKELTSKTSWPYLGVWNCNTW